jgi:3-hydroxybutyryl-CoA dehydrogenase
MRIVVLANDFLKAELLKQGAAPNGITEWINDINDFSKYPDAEIYIDLLFNNTENTRLEKLKSPGNQLIIVNDVIKQYQLPANFVRINGWPTMLERTVIEASITHETMKKKVESVFSCFNKKTEWVPDIPGFISARVIATIINEAYFALDEKISTKAEIDTAMKLGTNYPYGPFEWCDKIGLKNIFTLLKELEKENKRYAPCPLLEQEATS